MPSLPETIARHWVNILPLMAGGALLTQNPADCLFYADPAWPGMPEGFVRALERTRVLRAIGRAYAMAPTSAGRPPTPLAGTYPAITVYQPYAALIAGYAKPWELRNYRPPAAYVGRRIAVHAAARKIVAREVAEIMKRLRNGRAASACLDGPRAGKILERVLAAPDAVVRGAVVCTAVLGSPLRYPALMAKLRGWEDAEGEHGVGLGEGRDLWAWPLTLVEPLTSAAPAKGRQGWWMWSPDKELG